MSQSKQLIADAGDAVEKSGPVLVPSGEQSKTPGLPSALDDAVGSNQGQFNEIVAAQFSADRKQGIDAAEIAATEMVHGCTSGVLSGFDRGIDLHAGTRSTAGPRARSVPEPARRISVASSAHSHYRPILEPAR